ncbi:GGDEF domain-containing protein [Gemmatimonas groenlandica]|uniref:Diguanylate cyclase n=1 Tax=Gemmatimonas groenlandica TaxID=2732249 RepID=A0A6M4J089_9BACT|nr:diguanylate cyclase [Gemmatimonas groenlandica]QJR37881.1 diguanylate cyclase [Gemmatimonas groenlandica]
MADRDGTTPALVNTSRDDATLRILGEAVASAYDAVMITDARLDLPGPRIVFVNAAFERMTGWSAAELTTLTPRILQGPETDRTTLQRLRANLSAGEPFQGSTVNYRRDGSPFIMEWSINAVTDDDGAPRYFVAVQRDITAFRRRLAEAEEGARTDALTGLANRRAYDARLSAMLAQPDLVLGLLAMDIDRFKSVNDTYGHGAGDAVLVEVSRRMASIAASTPGALLARTGGEEFSMLMPVTSADSAAAIGERIRATVAAQPIVIDTGELDITISVGAATADPSMLAADRLSHAADRALYRAKEGGRDRVELAGVGDA